MMHYELFLKYAMNINVSRQSPFKIAKIMVFLLYINFL